jgi:phage gp16-like protein
MVTKGQIKLVHIAKTRLGLTDEEYHEILELYGGTHSSKDLSPGGFFNVMEHFRELGFQGKGGDVFGPVPTVKTKPADLIEMVTPAQKAKIRQLERDLGWSDNPARLQNFISKRFGIKKVLTKAQASKLIEALKAILARAHDAETGT